MGVPTYLTVSRHNVYYLRWPLPKSLHPLGKLTRRRLKHGVFQSAVDLQAAINRFIAEHNETEAKPFTWSADPDKIIAARNRGFQTLESIH